MEGLVRHASPLAAFCALALAACSTGDAGNTVTSMRDSAGITVVDNDVERATAACTIDSAPAVRIGTAEGDETYQFFRVFGARRLSDGRIVVVNQGSQQLRFYDSTGKYLSASGREGQGPGEFSNAFYLWVLPGDTIWVGDYRPFQFLVFAPDGAWKRTVRPSPAYTNSPAVMDVLDDGRSILADRGIQNRQPRVFTEQTLTPVIHAADGALIDTIGTYPNGSLGQTIEGPANIWMQPHFESYTRVASAGSRVVIGHGSTPLLSVYRLADSLTLDRLVRWTTVDRAVTPAAIEAERKRVRDEAPPNDPDMFKRLIEPMIHESRPAADVFPAFSGVTVGRDERIWVREYPAPGRATRRNYLGFDREGRFVCRLETPAFDNVYEFGADYMIALERDSLGVERVVRHRLSGPAARR